MYKRNGITVHAGEQDVKVTFIKIIFPLLSQKTGLFSNRKNMKN